MQHFETETVRVFIFQSAAMATLRHLLFNAAFIAWQKNPELKDYFMKKTGEGRHYFSALCAVERKLIHLIYAVWKRGTPFEQRKSTAT